MDWTWLLLDAAGARTTATDVMDPGQGFPSQSEAETWLGESWPALLAAGVEQVELREGDRRVYGPMSLRPGP